MIQMENPMKRILATAGIAGLALIGVAAPAIAGGDGGDGGDKVSICHATGSETNPYVEISISENALSGDRGHASHEGDIIPAPAAGCPGSSKGDDDGKEDCEEHETPPVVTPPVEETPPVVTPPVETPPVVTPPVVTPPVVTPPVVVTPAVVTVPRGAAAAPVVNRGFNAQTAAGSQPNAGIPAWFGGLAALLTAMAAVALRRGGRRQDAPSAD
jgi:hypothetical protein